MADKKKRAFVKVKSEDLKDEKKEDKAKRPTVKGMMRKMHGTKE